MGSERRTHVGRRLSEKQKYMETTVKRQYEPTYSDDEALVAFDSTTETAVTDTREPTHAPHRPQRVDSSGLTRFLRERWAELVMLPLLAWLFYQVYGINREIGELRSQLHEQQVRSDRLEQQLDRTENRLSGDIDKLHDRLDRPPVPPAAPRR